MTAVPEWPRAKPGQRRLLLHAGMHKTGTTALQSYLSRATAPLGALGVLYPLTGRKTGSTDHHCTAWLMTGDRRYRAEHGSLDELATEIAGFQGDAIVSSEGFGSLLGTPDGLAPLLRHPALRGHAATLLLYVREQASFAESLYFEMLRHGMADEAGRFCDSALALGQVRYREWTFHFDYWSVFQRLIATPDLTVAVRGYAGLIGGSSVSDFLAFTGLDSTGLDSTGLDSAGLGAPGDRANPRVGIGEALSLFCWHRVGWPPPADEAGAATVRLADGRMARVQGVLGTSQSTPASEGATLAAVAEHLSGGRVARLSSPLRAALVARFADGNRRLTAAARLPVDALTISPAVPSGSLALERLFSRDMQAAVLTRKMDRVAAVFATARLD